MTRVDDQDSQPTATAASPGVHAPKDDQPRTTRELVYVEPARPAPPKILSGGRIEQHRVPMFPAGIRMQRFGEVDLAAGSEAPILYERWPDGEVWETRWLGTELPAGTRFLPIHELDTVRFTSLPSVGYAVVLPGASVAWIFDVLQESPFALPLQGGVPLSRDRALAATVSLRAMRTCPGTETTCALYGSPRDVLAVRDLRRPLGDFDLVRREPDIEPAGLRYDDVQEQPSSTPGVRLRIERATAPSGGRVRRVTLLVDDHSALAFVSVDESAYPPDEPEEAVAASHDRLYVYDRLGRVSVHDRRTAERTESFGVVDFEPYYDFCFAGDEAIFVLPVFHRDGVGYALLFDGDRRAIFHRHLGDMARRVPLKGGPAMLSMIVSGGPPHLRLEGGALRLAQ